MLMGSQLQGVPPTLQVSYSIGSTWVCELVTSYPWPLLANNMLSLDQSTGETRIKGGHAVVD